MNKQYNEFVRRYKNRIPKKAMGVITDVLEEIPPTLQSLEFIDYMQKEIVRELTTIIRCYHGNYYPSVPTRFLSRTIEKLNNSGRYDGQPQMETILLELSNKLESIAGRPHNVSKKK